ncbi:MAG: methyl-accepting chemotaxis protein [Tepidanaerobacteraceae bacterium]|jgi:methyl-accepting chemotaxis protein|nr:methyl-accepting chemotaxis protein [Tepidanaerobacteraceae bacterium]MDK2879116.1 methyl-accepting chemotaxis protein [Thermoanaerobacteraceae bacterium]
MTVAFGLVVLIGCLALTFVTERRASVALESEAREAMLRAAKQAADTVESRINARVYVMDAISNMSSIQSVSESSEGSLEQTLSILNDELKWAQNIGFKQFGIADKSGNAVFSDGSKANVSDRDYFKAAIEGKTNISSTIVSRLDSSVIFAVASPLRNKVNKDITGVMIGLVNAEKISDLVGNITYGRSGYAFAVDDRGKIIAHKDSAKVLEQETVTEKAKTDASLASFASAVRNMIQGTEKVETYELQGQKYIIAYAPLKSTGWSLAVVAPESEVMEKTASLKRWALIASTIIILLALALTYAFSTSITTPLAMAVAFLGHVAAGDFTVTVPEKFMRMKDETGKLAAALAQLQANIRPLLSDLKKDAAQLASCSEILNSTSEEIASSSQEVAQAIQEVASGASDQAGHLQDILRLTENITSSLDKVYKELGNVRQNSEKTAGLTDIGKKELDELVGSIESVRNAFNEVAQKLAVLDGSVNQIGEILQVINDITDQTNLLALNAAIEAARAGEAGRGFAVVAEEVRKLAKQSRTSSDKIKVLLGRIASETKKAVNTSEEVGKQVVGQLNKIETTVKAFDDILDSTVAIMPMIEETYRQVDSTVKAKDVMVDRVQSISSVAEETSTAAEEISASAQELSASTEEIASSTEEILKVAKRLEEQVGKFKV